MIPVPTRVDPSAVLADLARPSERPRAASALAGAVGAEALLVLVRDPTVDAMVAAPGFSPTLPSGKGWPEVFDRAKAPGHQELEVEWPRGRPSTATLLASSDGAAFVFLGRPLQPGALEALDATLSVFAALLVAEYRAFILQGEAAAAREAAQHGRQLAAALESSRREVEALVRDQHRLNRVAQRLNATNLDLEKLVQTLTDETTALVGAQFGAFFYTSIAEDGESFLLYALSGAPRSAFERFGTPRNTAVFGPTFAGERIVRFDDVRESSSYGKSAPHFGMPEGHLPVVSYLAVPVTSHTGKVLGGLFFGHPERARFTEQHERLLTAVASHAATAMENAALYRTALQAEATQARLRAEAETQRTAAEHLARRRSQLQELTTALAEATAPDEVAEIATSLALRDIEALSSVAFFLNQEHGDARLASFRNADPRGPVTRWQFMPLDAPLPLAQAMRERRFISFETREALLDAFPNLADSVFTAAQLQAAVAVPLQARGGVIGGVAFSFSRPKRLSVDDQEFIISFATECTQALERARLLEAERVIKLQREALISELQQTIHNNELFAGVLAHDLRNPLSAITTAAQLAMVRAGSDQLLKPLSRVLSSGQRMGRMIDQLLDFTRLRVGGGVQLTPREVDLRELSEEVIEELEPVHPDWSMRLEAQGDCRGEWDRDRLMQVVSNLAANAVHHGVAEHGLTITVDGSHAEDVVLRVHNMGTVPAELLPRLFEPFRGSQQRRAGSKGLGLGLFITRMLVTAHGGEVSVTSTETEGTTFRVTLPRRRAG